MAFEFYPGAMFNPQHGGIGIYVKEGHTGVKTIEVRHANNESTWLVTPDRELLFVKDAHSMGSLRPLDLGFNKYVSLSMEHKTNKDFGINRIMVNSHQYMPKIRLSPNNRLHGKINNVNILSDSGGFQIVMGRTSYIDPLEVVKWYNKNVDTGIVLDIPCPFNDKPLLLSSAAIQNRNTDIMLEHKRPDLELMNVFHGFSANAYDLFREKVERPELNTSTCIAGVYHGNVLSAILDALHVITTGHKYKQYHLLGVYNVAVLAVVIKMAHMGLCEMITSDASSHIQSAMGRLYHHQSYPDSNAERIEVGITKRIKYPNVNKHLPCSCAVCSAIKYMDVFSVLDGATISYLLMYHNMFEIVRWTNMMDEFARTMSSKDYKEVVKKQLNSHSLKNSALQSLDMLDYFAEHGMEKTRKKFSYFLEENRLFEKRLVISDFESTDIPESFIRTNVEKAIERFNDPRVLEKLKEEKMAKKKDKKSKAVLEFKDDFEFLSNFYPSPVVGPGGLTYPTVEHAYQAAKSSLKEDWKKVQKAAHPGQAKKLGQKIKMVTNWDTIKIGVMKDLLEKKFKDEELGKKLVATGKGKLSEGNYWGDVFWGVDLKTGKGENHLGQLLMAVRKDVSKKKNKKTMYNKGHKKAGGKVVAKKKPVKKKPKK